MLSDKKSVLDLVTGGKDVPLKIQLEPETRNTILGGVILLGSFALLTALVASRDRRR